MSTPKTFNEWRDSVQDPWPDRKECWDAALESVRPRLEWVEELLAVRDAADRLADVAAQCQSLHGSVLIDMLLPALDAYRAARGKGAP